MSTRGGRGGWSGDKSKRFMMVGTKDPGGGAKTGVVAPVPINTPSLRQEIHGSQGDNTGIASINRASSGGGWGSAVGASSASESNADGHGTAGGKGKGRGDGSSRQGGGDDVFTRHFPDLRAGLEQAEKLDAVTKASSKVAPLRKPKPEPAKSQGPSLRPRAMLKPTGSAGGGSAATAAAQAAIADAVHNRVASAPKPEERRRPVTSFADEISTKSRWTERSQQDGGAKARRGGRGGEGRGFGGSAWETSKEGSRGFGKGGRGFDRGERGGDTFHDKDRRNSRHTADRSTMNNTRGRESIFGTGGHAGAANSSQDSTSSGTKAPTTTYVRQHGPPPRKPAAATPAPKPQHDDSPAIQQPTRSSAYSASARSSDQSREDSWGKVAETSSKWRPAQQSVDTPPEASPTLDSPSTQSVSYVRTYGPPRGSGRETQADEHSATSAAFSRQENDSGGEATSRFGSSWGTSEQSRGGADRESSGGAERTVSGRWKEPTSSLAPPPPPTNTRWKEPKEEPKTGARRWKAKEEGQTGSGGWGRSAEEDGDVDGGGAAAAALIPSPSQNSSWKESSSDGWGLEVGKRVEEMPTTSSTPDNVEDSVSIAAAIGANGGISGDKSVEVSGAEEPVGTPAQDIPTEDESTFRGSFTQQQQSQPVIRTASWEPQLPRGGGGGDLWDTQGHGRDSHPQQPGSGQGGPSTSGGASRPWSDPWGTSGFGLSASGDQGSGSMASFLDNDEPRKERYLPPALRNRTPSQGNQEDAANVPSVDDATETISNKSSANSRPLCKTGSRGVRRHLISFNRTRQGAQWKNSCTSNILSTHLIRANLRNPFTFTIMPILTAVSSGILQRVSPPSSPRIDKITSCRSQGCINSSRSSSRLRCITTSRRVRRPYRNICTAPHINRITYPSNANNSKFRYRSKFKPPNNALDIRSTNRISSHHSGRSNTASTLTRKDTSRQERDHFVPGQPGLYHRPDFFQHKKARRLHIMSEKAKSTTSEEHRDRDVSEPTSIEGHTTVDVKTGELVWEPEERTEEEPYSCAGSCGCPVPFNWRDTTFKSTLGWVKDNRVEWLAGITTGLTAVPTAVAFAILAGVKPSVGLRGTWIIMLVMALFGGRTGMVYSNSGSMGVIIEPFVEQEGDLGEEMVFYAFILAGIIQIGLGFLGVAKLLRLMPVSVIIGFVNGLAIVLFLAQMKNFQVLPNADEDENVEGRRLNSFSVFTDGSEWISGSELWYTLLIVVITMIVIVVYPMLIEKATGKWKGFKMIPPILVGIIVATIVEWVIVRGAAGYGGTRTLEDLSEKVSGTIPKLAWFDDTHDMPPLNSDTFSTILPTAISLMAVGLVESLMTVRLVNEITQTSSNIHREAIVGGVGNLVAGAFAGQGGNSEIGLTMVNVQSGGRTRIAATVSGLLVLLVVLVASPVINLIPLAGLVGVMLVISFNTFDWGSTLMVLAAALPERYRSHKAVFEKKISRADALIIVVVTVATPFTNLAVAVGIGIAVACLAFVWHNSEAVTAQSYYRAGYDIKDPPVIKVYEVMGNLFFASSETFLDLFDHRNDPAMVEVHLHTADIEDFSAMKTLETLGERYSNAGKHLRLRRVKKESLRVLTKAQALMSDDNLEVVMDDDPLMPQVSRHPTGVGAALVTSFFDRDPYTRRHRSRSMAEFPVANADLAPNTAATDAVENGVGNGHIAGVPRLVSAEV
eukprot:g3724.t1